ncbi:MAG: hypothetical protein L3J23_07275 [Flavobacteriaceae bacterium]|nr:hypothetical protein [Flavobacteriaceae bacterium]
MYKRIFLTLFFFVTLIISCTIPFKNYYYDKGITKPKKSKFKLAKPPYQLKKEDLIDINAVYINKHELSRKDGGKEPVESHLRFFNNGRYFYGGSVKPAKENLTHYNNLSNGFVGYYKINNNNKIIYEYFWVHEIGKYIKEYGYIRNDSIFMYKSSYKKNGFPKPNENNCQIYVRKKVDGLTGEASW